MAKYPTIGARLPEFENFSEEDWVRVFGTPEECREGFRQFERDTDLLYSRPVELAYPGEFVAAYNCQVVAHTATFEELREALAVAGILGESVAMREMPVA